MSLDAVWLRDVVLIPATMSVGTGIYTGFLVGRIFAFQQEIIRARQRVAEIPDRMERVVNAGDRTDAERVFQLLFHDIAQAFISTRQNQAAHDITTISLMLQERVLAFWDHHDRQRAARVAPNRMMADLIRFTEEAVDVVSADLEAIRPNWAVLLLGSWWTSHRRESGTVV